MTTWRPAEPDCRDTDPRPVGESLDRVTQALGAPRARDLATLFSQWEKLVGREIAQHAEPRFLRDGVLMLVVDQPAWAAQLRYLVPELLARIRAGVSGTAVTEIQIRVAVETGPAPGLGRTPRGRDRRLEGFDEGPVDRRRHPPLVEWGHRSSGR